MWKFSLSGTKEVKVKPDYNFLVCAALQEELKAFYSKNQAFKNKRRVDRDAYELSFKFKGQDINLLTYSPNQMGMPFNAASIMNIINIHNPRYVIMIGTCATIKQSNKLGDVLVPTRAFSYESGKFQQGKFVSDFNSKIFSDSLIKQAENCKDKLPVKSYTVICDEEFGSGSAVINDEAKVLEIKQKSSRKLSGIDMEAFSLACINEVLGDSCDVIVVKGISDFAIKKDETELKGNGKQIAINNSADFCYRLIKHLQSENFTTYVPKVG